MNFTFASSRTLLAPSFCRTISQYRGEQVHSGKARSHSGLPFFLNCIYWLEAIESNWMKRSVIYERLSGANYLSIHSVLSLHSFIIHSRRCTVVACIAVVKAHSIDRWLSKL